MNPFKSLLSIFNKGGDSVIGIDIGSSSIKVVQLRKKNGRAILETYGELALGPYAGIEVGRATNLAPAQVVEALKDVLRESNVTTNKCGMAIPLSSTLISLVELPAIDERELAQMIPIEARKYIPVPVSEVSLNWWVVPRENQSLENSALPPETEMSQPPAAMRAMPEMPKVTGKIDVLIVAVHNESLGRYQEIIKGAGLDCGFLEIELFSAIRSSLDQEVGPVMIFDMGAGATKLYIIERGIVRISHTINRGSQDLTIALSRALNIQIADAESLKRELGIAAKRDGRDMSQVISSTLNFIFSEANRVLFNYQRKFNKVISKIVLSGGGVNLKGFGEMAKTSFQAPVEFSNAFAKTDSPAFLSDVLQGAGPEFAVAIGIALRRLQEME